MSFEKLRDMHLLVGYDDMILLIALRSILKSNIIKWSNCHEDKIDISLEYTWILAEATMYSLIHI